MTSNAPADHLLAPIPAEMWTRREAAHLLWRTGFGATEQEIRRAVEDGPVETLNRRLAPQPEEHEEFLSVEPLLRRIAHESGSIADLKAWWLYRMLYSANPLVEKMSLFWHNHFATSYAKVRSVEHMAAQNDLIRRHALGRFSDLLHGMARDVAMLIWLDGNANRKRHPNENFAREVMELFSLGVGNYTEDDIKQAARAFTGWHLRNGKFWFNRLQHDPGPKTVFGKTGRFGGDDIIDLCLAHPACPRFLASKLLRFFVMPEPSAEAVDALAARIRAHEFAMAPVLRELFSSRLFYSPEARHAIIKSPIDLVLGTIRTLEGRANLLACSQLLAELGQDIFEPPTVKGWDGGRAWINSATMLLRTNFAAEIATGERFGRIQEPLEVVEREGLQTPEQIVAFYIELLLSRDLDAATVGPLVEYLTSAAGDRRVRLRGTVHLILAMPEYELT